jgi:hypothetical protein
VKTCSRKKHTNLYGPGVELVNYVKLYIREERKVGGYSVICILVG